MKLPPHTKTQVVVVKSDDIDAALTCALSHLGGLEKILHPFSSILIKPNFCGGVPGDPGSHTSINLLESLLAQLSPLKKKVFIGEADGSFNRADEVFSVLNVHPLAKRYDAQVVNLSTGPYLEIDVPSPLSLKKVRVSRLLTECAIISVAALKTHPWTGVTFSMKNMYGAIYDQEKALFHNRLDKNIVDITMAIPPTLCLVDGIYAVKRGGFKYGVWVGFPPDRMDLLVAGRDPVATDTVCTTLLGRNPSDIKYLELAAAQKLGVNELSQIEVITENCPLPWDP